MMGSDGIKDLNLRPVTIDLLSNKYIIPGAMVSTHKFEKSFKDY